MLPRVQAAHLQTTSPLFSVIPPKIHNLIFWLALHGYPDRTRGYYPGNAFYYHPGYEHDRHIDTVLLLTCRRIYNETHLLPVIENEHYLLEGRFPGSCAITEMHLRKLKIMIRESRWWFELNQSLVLKDKWTNNIRLLKCLEEFEMELEMIERDKGQMLTIAQRISDWKIELWDGRVLSTDGHSFVHD
ncbi:hypothetical protein ARMGADRAFT_1039459 [Armillaria gallica]|uniref:Uncharacterized protein n=1 Tax=Armillaria gallica TaxID=47427 RepID=A0A2H3CSA8_ARMGA|nr:hypothetical protein ARMGADRAFT_1039459 [Armillaria gallica]